MFLGFEFESIQAATATLFNNNLCLLDYLTLTYTKTKNGHLFGSGLRSGSG